MNNTWTTMENTGDPFPYEMLKINGVDSHYIIVEETFYGCRVRYVVDNVVKYNEYLPRMKADEAKEHAVLIVEAMTPENSKYYNDVQQLVKDEIGEREEFEDDTEEEDEEEDWEE